MKTVHEAMRELNMSQVELAHRAKVTESCISYILSGKRNPSILTATRIAHALDLELPEFIAMLYPAKYKQVKS